MRGLARGNNPNNIVTTITERNHQRSILIAASQEPKPVFVVRMQLIKLHAALGVIECGNGFIKAYSVQAYISFGFAGIPSEAHDHSLST